MKITIKDTEVTLKQTFRTSMLYENAMGESFGQNITTTNFIFYFYCNILGSQPGLSLNFDEVIDYLDENPNVLQEYTLWLAEINKVNDKFKGLEDTKKNETEKKVKKSKKNE